MSATDIAASKQLDVTVFRNEAREAGFTNAEIALPELFDARYFESELDGLLLPIGTRGEIYDYVEESLKTFWRFQAYTSIDLGVRASYAPESFSSKLIEELDLSDEQIFFLNWSNGWMDAIKLYWDGKTEFTCVGELIDDLKANYELVYHRPGGMSKSAIKR